MNKKQAASELRKAIQLFLETLDAETQEDKIMEVASVFPEYETGRLYRAKDIFKFGENAVGDSQLYLVLQEHTSCGEWKPDEAVSLYKAIGVSEDGLPLWVQPLGDADSYKKGDKVMHKGGIWVSETDANVWEPGVYGWLASA